MVDDSDYRGRRPLANTEILDDDSEGPEPDVEVFSLDVQTPAHQRVETRSRKRRWVEDARTTVWESGEPPPAGSRSVPDARPVGSVAVPLSGTSSRSLPVRRSRSQASAGWAQDVPYEEVSGPAGREPRLIEAPVRVQVKSVARISPDPRLWIMTRPDSAPAEQFRVLALRLREECAARVVAVTSPTRRGEGQLAAANLALAFSEGGRSKTVLLDADMRGSEVGELFDLAEGPGLADQIRQHRRNPDQNWVTLGMSSTLHYLPAGSPERNPASLLSSEVMGDLMVQLRRYFDFIVIGTPPVLESADVNILQEHVDGVLLVVRSGITRRDSVAATVERLGNNRFLGTALVDIKRKAAR